MRSESYNAKIFDPLMQEIRLACRQRKIKNVNRYINAVLLNDLLREHRNALIDAVANARPTDQEMLMEYFLTVPDTLETMMEWVRSVRPLQKRMFRNNGSSNGTREHV